MVHGVDRLVMQRTVAPEQEPLTLGEAKEHLRVTSTADDDHIVALIQVAREHVEEVTGRALVTQTWTRSVDRFGTIFLPRPPLIAVTSVTYVDTDGNEQTLATSVYDVQANELPPRITLAHDEFWPTARSVPNAITVTYTAGYGDPFDVPEPLKHAIRLLIGDMFLNREDTVTGTVVARLRAVDSLLAPYRVRWF